MLGFLSFSFLSSYYGNRARGHRGKSAKVVSFKLFILKNKKIAYYWNCGTFHSTLLDCIVVHISVTKEAQ